MQIKAFLIPKYKQICQKTHIFKIIFPGTKYILKQ